MVATKRCAWPSKKRRPPRSCRSSRTSGLRGRGGAGFPTGVKWGFPPKDSFPRTWSCNADESEPGTFNNHEMIDKNPHQLIEGMALAAYAIGGCDTAYIYIRGEFAYGARVLERGDQQRLRQRASWARTSSAATSISTSTVHRGAGAYICGEETALIESLEGKIGQPRAKPPFFPAAIGLYMKPTIVNNVETLINVPPIVAKGAAWYRTFGTERSPGTKVCSLSGHVNKPGNYEVPLGMPLRELIYAAEYGGGIRGGLQPKIIVPGGASAPWLTRRAARRHARLRGGRGGRLDARHRRHYRAGREHQRG